jgi:hypothetical protein
MERRALITGITGQDGSYLAELLVLCFLHPCHTGRLMIAGRISRPARWPDVVCFRLRSNPLGPRDIEFCRCSDSSGAGRVG